MNKSGKSTTSFNVNIALTRFTGVNRLNPKAPKNYVNIFKYQFPYFTQCLQVFTLFTYVNIKNEVFSFSMII